MTRKSFVLALLALLLPAMAVAEVFTLTLENGATFETRYRPKLSYPDEDKVMLLTSNGNWIAFPRERVAAVEVDFESKGYGLVIDNTTISLGFAPNETSSEEETPADPASRLLRYLEQRDAGQQNQSVEQFVNTDSAGSAGFPSTFSTGGSSSTNTVPGGFALGTAVLSSGADPGDGGGAEQ